MLVTLGKRAASGDVVDLLLECHARIRAFLALAATLARSRAATADEIHSVAGQVRRYFVESLPLHVADERETIAPRLAAAGDEVGRALVMMEAEHGAHEPCLAQLVALCDALVRDPAGLAGLAGDLATVAARLTTELGSHLAFEERVIFPALRQLSAGEREAMRDEMRARRGG